MIEAKDLVFREVAYGSSDYADYLRIRNEGLGNAYEGGLATDNMDKDSDKTHFLLYHKSNGKKIPVAVTRTNPTDDASVFEIQFVAVEKNHRSQGFGNHLMDLTEDYLIKQGAETILIPVRETAIGFYEKRGYSILSEIEPLHVSKNSKTKNLRCFYMKKEF